LLFRVVWSEIASGMLGEIADRRVRQSIYDRAKELQRDPEKQGYPLQGDLAGLRAVRAAGQRYRIIYSVDRGRIVVHVLATGIRKERSRRDIYALAERLVRLKLAERGKKR